MIEVSSHSHTSIKKKRARGFNLDLGKIELNNVELSPYMNSTVKSKPVQRIKQVGTSVPINYRPSKFVIPTIATHGFSTPNHDSTSCCRGTPYYVRRTMELNRNSLAFMNSTERMTGVPYEPSTKSMLNGSIFTAEELARMEISFRDEPEAG